MEEVTIDDLNTYKNTMFFVSVNTVLFLVVIAMFGNHPSILAIFFVIFFAGNVAAFEIGKLLSEERLK